MRLWLPALVAAEIAGILTVDRGLFLRTTSSAAWPLALAASVACIILAAGAARSRAAIVSIACAGFLVGALALETRRIEVADRPDLAVGERVLLDARVERVETRGERTRLELGALHDLERGMRWPGRIRLFVGRDESGFGLLSLRRAGDRLRLRAVVRPIDGPRNPGARDTRASNHRRGVWATATLATSEAWVSIEDEDEQGARSSSLWGDWARVRREASVAHLASLGPGGGVLAALGLGAADVLEPTFREALRRLGLSHLVAISGLHLLMVAALGFSAAGLCVRLGRLGDRIDPAPVKGVAAVLAAAAFAALSGFGVPARRALVLLVLGIGLHALGRRSAWPSAWCVAATATLAFDPGSLFELGPQLSFGVTAALAWARFGRGELADEPGGRTVFLLQAALRLLEVSAVALAASAFILAAHGRPTSSWALIANVVAVPLTGVVLLPVSLIAGAVTASGLTGGLGEAFLAAGAATMSGFVQAVELAAASVEPSLAVRPSGTALVAALGSVVAAARAPTPALRCAAALACVALVTSDGPALLPSQAELVAFDVGQGDALLLHGDGAAILVDTGWASPEGDWNAGERVVVPGLRALGVDRLDLLVVTHADLDHRGGAEAVLDAIEVERIQVPTPAAGAPGFASLRARARELGVRWEPRARGDAPIHVGPFTVEALWPLTDAVVSSANESSLVLRVSVGDTRLLLMGDAGFATERALLARSDDLRASVLKLGHHGSRTATSTAFMTAVSPEWVVVSAGCSVGRALPHPDTLARVAAGGRGRLRWTGRDGAIRLRLSGRVREHPGLPRPRPRRCQL